MKSGPYQWLLFTLALGAAAFICSMGSAFWAVSLARNGSAMRGDGCMGSSSHDGAIALGDKGSALHAHGGGSHAMAREAAASGAGAGVGAMTSRSEPPVGSLSAAGEPRKVWPSGCLSVLHLQSVLGVPGLNYPIRSLVPCPGLQRGRPHARAMAGDHCHVQPAQLHELQKCGQIDLDRGVQERDLGSGLRWAGGMEHLQDHFP